jgi:hypothetical protein
MRFFIAFVFLSVPLLSRAAPNWEASMYVGPSLSQSGEIEDLGDPNTNVGFELDYFFGDRHGLGISSGNEFDWGGGDEFPEIETASISTFDLHYAFRYRFKDTKYRLFFAPGIGSQTIYNDPGDYWEEAYQDLSTAWVINYKLMVDYVVHEWESNEDERWFFVGAGVTQIFSFNDEYQGKDISGNRLSGIVRIGIGF